MNWNWYSFGWGFFAGGIVLAICAIVLRRIDDKIEKDD